VLIFGKTKNNNHFQYWQMAIFGEKISEE
jgi:hypothetical protein